MINEMEMGLGKQTLPYNPESYKKQYVTSEDKFRNKDHFSSSADQIFEDLEACLTKDGERILNDQEKTKIAETLTSLLKDEKFRSEIQAQMEAGARLSNDQEEGEEIITRKLIEQVKKQSGIEFIYRQKI